MCFTGKDIRNAARSWKPNHKKLQEYESYHKKVQEVAARGGQNAQGLLAMLFLWVTAVFAESENKIECTHYVRSLMNLS